VARLIDLHSEFGSRAERRLREDTIAWLVTVARDGTPQPTPVWFVYDGHALLIYSIPGQPKVRNIERNARVALHLDSQDHGDDIVVVIGDAAVDPSAPPVHQNRAYVDKYGDEIIRIGLAGPEAMAKTYSLAIRITPTKIRGF